MWMPCSPARWEAWRAHAAGGEAPGFDAGALRDEAERALRRAEIVRALINDPSINAFVAGGQIVYLHSGLIAEADHIGQLQAVIAHELGHQFGAPPLTLLGVDRAEARQRAEDWLTAVGLAALYPFTKRYTHLPQLFLGLAFGWAVGRGLVAGRQRWAAAWPHSTPPTSGATPPAPGTCSWGPWPA